jgi:hypothetical protein
MSRLVGIVALVIAFGWSGFILWRLANQRTPQDVKVQLQPKPIANIETVQRDLCSLAQAEVDYRHLTGRYAEIHELANERRTEVPDSRWPYSYMLYLPPESSRFLIVAVSLTPIETQPRVLQIDDQMQVQSRSHPPQVYPCKRPRISESH